MNTSRYISLDIRRFISGSFLLFAALSLYVGNVRAGRHLHKGILENIVASPMLFFDTTPTGRILNRFSKDIDVIDVTLAQNVRMWLGTVLQILTVPIVVGYSTPLILATMVPMAILYFVIQVSDKCLFTLDNNNNPTSRLLHSGE